MKTLALSLLFTLTWISIEAQTVRLKTFCNGNARVKEVRPTSHGSLIRMWCKEDKTDYFLFSGNLPDSWRVLADDDMPRGRCRIISPRNVDLCRNFRVRSNGLEYEYNFETGNWTILQRPYTTGTSFGNHDED